MQHLARSPWVAAGVALVGAGTIAAAPVVAPLAGPAALHSPDVALTSWQDVFDTASANATTIWDTFSAHPFVAQQQEIANQIGYLQDLANGSTTIGDVLDSLKENAAAVFNAVTFLGGDDDAIGAVSQYTIDQAHIFAYIGLSGLGADLGFPVPEEPIPTIVNFLTSPLSAVLIGALGPSISPLVALGNSISEIGETLNGDNPDWQSALQQVADIPANMTGAFLNGATLDLTALIPAIEATGLIALPEGASLDELSFAFGGLLSTGGVLGSDYSDTALGGSILNSLGLHVSDVPILGELDAVGHGIGTLAALENLSQIVASTLGWDWSGNPLDGLFDTL
ncbi:outer membrane porin GjpA [Mycolicibacter heraklionensis]|uniref:Outer membrane porin GjpA n=1 Tax=Mycolicibacter heraklionensis TaxID=512402 RepID=A0A9X7WE82_9MYCO|nr:outer membrane porin GjpA [Mycolicibacter heraklionensis]QZA06436.1 outer membrane porin GjpA [Mycolicibacter heraklionensis]